MVVLMSTEGRTDGRLVLDAHQHECSMRSKRSAHVYDSMTAVLRSQLRKYVSRRTRASRRHVTGLFLVRIGLEARRTVVVFSRPPAISSFEGGWNEAATGTYIYMVCATTY